MLRARGEGRGVMQISHVSCDTRAHGEAAATRSRSHSRSRTVLAAALPDHSPHAEKTYTRLRPPDRSQRAARELQMTKAGNKKTGAKAF